MFELSYTEDPGIPEGREREVLSAHVSAWDEEEVDAFWENVGNWGVPMPGAGTSIEEARQMIIDAGVRALEWLATSPEVSWNRIAGVDYFFCGATHGGQIPGFDHLRVIDELRLPLRTHLHLGALAVWYDPDGPPQLVEVVTIEAGAVWMRRPGDPTLTIQAPEHEVILVQIPEWWLRMREEA